MSIADLQALIVYHTRQADEQWAKSKAGDAARDLDARVHAQNLSAFHRRSARQLTELRDAFKVLTQITQN